MLEMVLHAVTTCLLFFIIYTFFFFFSPCPVGDFGLQGDSVLNSLRLL